MPTKQPSSCKATGSLSRFRPSSNVFWRFLHRQTSQRRDNIWWQQLFLISCSRNSVPHCWFPVCSDLAANFRISMNWKARKTDLVLSIWSLENNNLLDKVKGTDKVLLKRQSISINRQDVSTSINTQMDSLIPPSKISWLTQGMFVGSVSDNFNERIEQNIFHAVIVVDTEKGNGRKVVIRNSPSSTISWMRMATTVWSRPYRTTTTKSRRMSSR